MNISRKKDIGFTSIRIVLNCDGYNGRKRENAIGIILLNDGIAKRKYIDKLKYDPTHGREVIPSNFIEVKKVFERDVEIHGKV
jgi:hypothetical protein